MWNCPTPKQLAKLPRFYATEKDTLKDKVIKMHFFMGGCDWYAVEYDPKEENFFGFAILNGDLQNAEWGYFSLRELRELKITFVEVDRDLHWKPCKAMEVEKIREAQGWGKEKELAAI